MLNTLPVPSAQVARLSNSAVSLSDLAKVIRAEHAAVVSTFSRTLGHALAAGRALIEAKSLVGHGRWIRFLKDCALGERQAERYAQLARLHDANPSSGTDFAGLSIQVAIKRLSQSNTGGTHRASSQPPAPEKLNSLAWANASPVERARFISAVGWRSLSEAIPADWHPAIEQWLDHKEVAITIDQGGVVLPDDLSVPHFLRRDLHTKAVS